MESLVGFVGYECEDIGLYVAMIFHEMGKKIALVDRTEQEMLLEMLEVQKDKATWVRKTEYAGIFITNQSVSLSEFDYIIYLFGYRLLHPKLYECETVLMVTDCIPAHALLLGKMDSWNRRNFLVLRNLIPMKHTEKYLALLADCENGYCEIPYDERDIRMRGNLSYSNCGKLNRLSLGMKRGLVYILKFILPESDEKVIWNMIKKL